MVKPPYDDSPVVETVGSLWARLQPAAARSSHSKATYRHSGVTPNKALLNSPESASIRVQRYAGPWWQVPSRHAGCGAHAGRAKGAGRVAWMGPRAALHHVGDAVCQRLQSHSAFPVGHG